MIGTGFAAVIEGSYGRFLPRLCIVCKPALPPHFLFETYVFNSLCLDL